jgi:hypothetical protein
MHDSRQRFSRVLRGKPISGAVTGPEAVHACATWAGVSVRDYTLNPHVLADCVIRDAYQKAIATGVDIVLLAGPPCDSLVSKRFP